MKNLLLVLFLGTTFFSCEKTIEYNTTDIPADFVALSKPKAGEGYQMHVPAYPIPSNFEREWFLRVPVGNKEEIYVNSFDIKCRPGTHHLVAYGFKDENAANLPPIGVMRDQNGLNGKINLRANTSSSNMLLSAQSQEFSLKFPPGMALRLNANASLDLNSHYFNKTSKTIFGEAYVNVNTIPKSQVTQALFSEFVDNAENLILPPKAKTKVTYTETFSTDITIYVMSSHMHKRGEKFEIYGVGGEVDGQLLYVSVDYEHPPYKFFNKPLQLKKGQGLRTVVTYNNESNREIRYGVTSEDEMGLALLFFTQK
jgi:hypothetical protein